MAIKKSELYSTLWASCDELRGGMDPAQYKDYVLIFLFIKYVSDKYINNHHSLIQIPKGSSFNDMANLVGDKEIGDKINKRIIAPIAKENDLQGVIDVVDFDDDEKLGKGPEKVDRLSRLIRIFQNPALDFSKNRAEGDDILGDAYEYLMRHFASESGKSKGEFYTPGEVSRVLAKVLNIHNATNQTTFYDPTCGSGSLLLKAFEEANGKGTIYGQEKSVATAALAKMNMILHHNDTSKIERGQSTLSNPLHWDKHGFLKTFDYIVANPPFSSKNWSTGFDPANDVYGRFEADKIPPEKNGDYAFLLHIIKSLKANGKAACILPHGVLFRGNIEATIRKSLIKRGYIKGVIGLPANLFYGTGIPACVIVIDKEYAEASMDLSNDKKGIFMIDASKGYAKDGNKNRLREQDIHKIVDVFNKQIELPKYSRLVTIKEIADPKNDYNLNIPRYIDSQEEEDVQDIEAHLLGDIPDRDIEALNEYWAVYPNLKKELFSRAKRKGYQKLNVKQSHIKLTIFGHKEFVNYAVEVNNVFKVWRKENSNYLKALGKGLKPKQVISRISEDILTRFRNKQLIDAYDVYQHVMSYWENTMQDDIYSIAVEGWKAEVQVTKQTKKEIVWDCDLIPKTYIINRYFQKEKKVLDQLHVDLEVLTSSIKQLEEEHSGDDGMLENVKNNKGKITKANAQNRVMELKEEIAQGKATAEQKSMAKTIKKDFATIKWKKGISHESFTELDVLYDYLVLVDKEQKLKEQIKLSIAELDAKTLARYKTLTEQEIKQLVVDDKWMPSIENLLHLEMDYVSQRLTDRVNNLCLRYERALPFIKSHSSRLESKVDKYLTDITSKKSLLDPRKGWKPIRIGQLGRVYGGLSGKSKADFENGKHPYIPFMNVMTNTVIDTQYFDYVNIKSDETQNIVKKGDLIFNGSSETPEEVGMCSVLLEEIPNLYLNSFCFGFRLNKDLKTNPLYLAYFFRSPHGRKLFYSLAQGATRYNLSKSNFMSAIMPIPNYEEQTRIANILFDIESEIKLLGEKLNKYENLRLGVIQKIL